jgi:hypothetical protein
MLSLKRCLDMAASPAVILCFTEGPAADNRIRRYREAQERDGPAVNLVIGKSLLALIYVTDAAHAIA